MNKQIKKLVKQVGGIGYGEDNEQLTPMLIDKQIEKFAKLVIEECGEVAFCHSHVSGYELKELFKKHFKIK